MNDGPTRTFRVACVRAEWSRETILLFIYKGFSRSQTVF
jgi:hypothetical protein